MITGMHALLMTTDEKATRDFIRDVMDFSFYDAGGGFLIYTPEKSEFGVHQADQQSHEVSFHCDDLRATIEELKAKGVEFVTPVEEQTWGWNTRFQMPGVGPVQLYQPKYEMP